ncbi:MAG: M42 family metallopeptidase [Firmicutes bacterium]|nr:M42 family metallopeptidase [Bacillota bacterium]
MDRKYAEFAAQKAIELLAIDSPSGFADKATDWVVEEFSSLGFKAKKTVKGGVLTDLGGTDVDDALLLEAHADTLGGMVCEIKGDGKIYEGTAQLINASLHVNGEYNDIKRTFDSMEIVLDEDVKNAADVKNLGIENGDFVCFEPRSRITESGYIKSRFLDDKLSVAILLGFAKYISDNKITLPRKTFIHVTVYEEVGHGGSASVPQGVTEAISVDMGCVGKGLACTEKQVSVCVKDSGGPYSYKVVSGLINAAKRENADYAADVYPHYGSDVEATLRAGNDIRHGLIGAGVYASHGYERSHINGVYNTLKVLKGYLKI